MKPLIIVGAGGHGKVVLDCAIAANIKVAGFLDSKQAAGTKINDAEILGNNDKLNDADFISAHSFIVALGSQQARADISKQILQADGELATVIHPSCIISPSAKIGRGTAIIAGAIINSNAKIGDYCIINTGATIDHDVVLEDGVQISPGANLAGTVYCCEGVFIGTGAIIIPNIRLAKNARVSAGAVVFNNLSENIVVSGNPAKIVK